MSETAYEMIAIVASMALFLFVFMQIVINMVVRAVERAVKDILGEAINLDQMSKEQKDMARGLDALRQGLRDDKITIPKKFWSVEERRKEALMQMDLDIGHIEIPTTPGEKRKWYDFQVGRMK